MRLAAAAPLALALLAGCAPTALDAPAGPVLAAADTVAAVPFGPRFTEARAVAADARGLLYVADAGADVVSRLAPDGAVLETLGGPGTGDYAFLAPAGIDPTNGLALYVADSGNGRIQRFSHEGRLLETLVVPADPEAALAGREPGSERGRPVAVAAAPAGEVYVVEEQRGVVLRWDERRSFERVVGGAEAGRGALRRPVGLALLADRRLAVADAGHGAVLVYDAFGTFQRRIADGVVPGVVAVTASGARLAVVLPDRVLVYGADGMLERVLAFALPEPLVGAALGDDGLVLLTRTGLWRAAPAGW